MSSRMFLSVREARGLCYYIHTSTDDYTDVGVNSTNAGVALDKIDDAVKAVVEEYGKALNSEITGAELEKSKNFLKGKMVLRLEDTEEFAHLLGKFELLYGKARSPEDIFDADDNNLVLPVIRGITEPIDMESPKEEGLEEDSSPSNPKTSKPPGTPKSNGA